MQRVDKHAIEMEPPDLLHVTLSGPLRTEEVRAINLLTQRDNPIRFFDTEQEARA